MTVDVGLAVGLKSGRWVDVVVYVTRQEFLDNRFNESFWIEKIRGKYNDKIVFVHVRDAFSGEEKP